MNYIDRNSKYGEYILDIVSTHAKNDSDYAAAKLQGLTQDLHLSPKECEFLRRRYDLIEILANAPCFR